jgi:hypothetical protein
LLRGDPDTLSGLIDEDVFENNYRKLEKEYEEYILTEGDFDERMYLSPEKQADFGMDSPNIDYLKSFECQSPYRTYPPLQEVSKLIIIIVNYLVIKCINFLFLASSFDAPNSFVWKKVSVREGRVFAISN